MIKNPCSFSEHSSNHALCGYSRQGRCSAFRTINNFDGTIVKNRLGRKSQHNVAWVTREKMVRYALWPLWMWCQEDNEDVNWSRVGRVARAGQPVAYLLRRPRPHARALPAVANLITCSLDLATLPILSSCWLFQQSDNSTKWKFLWMFFISWSGIAYLNID